MSAVPVPLGLSAPLLHAWLKAQTALGVPFEDVTEEFLASALEELRDAKVIKATEAIQALACYKKLKPIDPDQRAALLSAHLAPEPIPAPVVSVPFAAAPLDLSFVDPVAPLPPPHSILQISQASLSMYPSGSPSSSVMAPSPQSTHSLAATPSARAPDPAVLPSPSVSRSYPRVPSLAVGGPSPAYRASYDVDDLSASFNRGFDPYLGAHSLSQSSASVYDRSYFSASDADEILPPTNHRSSSRDPEAEPVSSQSPSARSSASIRSTGSAPVSVRGHLPSSQQSPAPSQTKSKSKPPSSQPSKTAASKESKMQPDGVRRDPDGFTVVTSKKTAKASPSGRPDEKAEKNPQCPARCKCKKRLECPLKHSQAERRIFALMDLEHNEKVKTNLCYQFKDGVHCMWGKDHCKGAHGREDGWCSYCGQCGHFVVECALLANQPKRTAK